MQVVVQEVSVVGTEEGEAVDQVKRGVTAKVGDVADQATNLRQGETVRSSACGRSKSTCLGILLSRTGSVFMQAAPNRRDETDGRSRMSDPYKVKESMQCGSEGAGGEGVPVDDIDSELQRDHVCRQVADACGSERVEKSIAGVAEVDGVQSQITSNFRGPDVAGAGDVGAMADGGSVVDPTRPRRSCLRGRQRRISTHGHDVDFRIVRQPHPNQPSAGRCADPE